MNDVVVRLLRELPDTDKDRYDIAFERGRAQARSSLLFGGMTIGLVAGALGLFLLDPVVGSGRRAQLAKRAKAVLNDLQRTIDRRPPEPREQRRVAGCGGCHDRGPAEARGQDSAAERRGERGRRTDATTTPRIGCPSLPAPRSADRGSGRRGRLGCARPDAGAPGSG